MSKNKERKKVKKIEDKIQIKEPDESYPVFCFKYLQECSYDECIEAGFFISFMQRLKKLSELGWKQIDKSHRHSYGTEKIPLDQIKRKNLPAIVTEEVKALSVFRATGDNRPFLGLRENNIFHVIFIESCFGDIYDHK